MVESRKTNEKVVYSTLSSKKQITLPAMIREKLGAESGDQVGFDYNVETKEVILWILFTRKFDLILAVRVRGSNEIFGVKCLDKSS